MENTRCGEISELLDQLEDIVESGKAGFISNKVTINKDEIKDLIQDIRLKLPTEVQQSVWIMDERNKIIDDAKKEAQAMIKDAKEKQQSLIDQNDIVEFAREKANTLVDSAKADAQEMRLGAIEYVDSRCREIEDRLGVTLKLVHEEAQAFEHYIADLLKQVSADRGELKEMIARLENNNN